MNIFERDKNNLIKDNPLALSALRLLQFESDIRDLKSKSELYFHLTHDLSIIAPFDCSMLFVKNVMGRYKLELVKNIPEVDGSGDLIQKIQAWLDNLTNTKGSEIRRLLMQEDFSYKSEKYPFNFMLWMPVALAGENVLGVFLFRKQAFTDNHVSLLQRLAKTYGHALGALQPKKKGFFQSGRIGSKPFKISLIAIFFIAIFIPVPYSVLASVEVIPRDPYVVTAPFNGVVKRIAADTNSNVHSGQLLVQFDDLKARNERNIALQRLEVANAKLENVTALAFDNIDAGYDQAIAYTEYGLAQLEAAYAEDNFALAKSVSPVDGIAIYTDKNDWEGKAVQMGEQILEIADPEKIQYFIELPVSDVIAIKKGTSVTVYLDSSPLGGHTAVLDSISYKPNLTDGGVMAYTLLALPQGGHNPRIGSRGTARIHSGYAPLVWQVIRRPVQFVRQRLGL